MTDALTDSYLKMIEESEQKRKELTEQIQDKEDIRKRDDKSVMERISDEYSRNFSYT